MPTADDRLAAELRRTTAFVRLVHVDVATSTMDLAAADPDDAPAIFWADHQTRGRGRQQRPWHDLPALGLAVTFRVRPLLPLPVALPAVVPLCVLETLAAAGAAPLRLKWPNDVLLADRKIAGVLIDAATARPGVYLIGIGVNVNEPELPPAVADLATSLRRHTGRDHDRWAMLGDLASRLDRALSALARGEHAAFEERYRHHLGLLGRRVVVRTGAATTGVLRDLSFAAGAALADGRSFPLGQIQELRAE